MHNNRGSITTVISSHAKDKNWIFTGYQIFVTGKILVFHRCLYNKDYFYQEIVVFSHQSFVACVPIALIFFFSLPLIFILLATSISRFLTAAMIFSCFLVPAKFVPFLLPAPALFSVIHVTSKKSRLCCCFFLSKSPAGYAIFPQNKLKRVELHYGCIWLLIELFSWSSRAREARSGSLFSIFTSPYLSCLPPPTQILHYPLFLISPEGEIEDNGYAKFWEVNEVHYGLSENGEWVRKFGYLYIREILVVR